MSKSKTIAKAVITTALAASLAGGTVTAMAGKKMNMVKCYGVAKKGQNDCGNKRHACAGQATKNNQPDEWKYLTKKDCLKKGGSVNKPKA